MVNSSGSGTTFVSDGDWVPLAEAAIAEDGTLPVCIIQTGWSKNRRYYSEAVLRAAARLYRAGTHNLWNHPGPAKLREQPSGDLNDIASVLSEDTRYLEAADPGAFRGAGLYSRVRPVSAYRERIAELAETIGLSHRVSGRQKLGTAEGRRGWLVEEILDPGADPTLPAITVDWVAHPAAGGAVLAESEEIETMTDKQIQEQVAAAVSEATGPLNEAIAARDAEIATLHETIATLRAEAAATAASAVLREELDGANLPPAAADRLRAVLTVGEGEETDAYRARVAEAIAAERAYLEAVAPQPAPAPAEPLNPGVPFAEGENASALALVRELRAATGR